MGSGRCSYSWCFMDVVGPTLKVPPQEGNVFRDSSMGGTRGYTPRLRWTYDCMQWVAKCSNEYWKPKSRSQLRGDSTKQWGDSWWFNQPVKTWNSSTERKVFRTDPGGTKTSKNMWTKTTTIARYRNRPSFTIRNLSVNNSITELEMKGHLTNHCACGSSFDE